MRAEMLTAAESEELRGLLAGRWVLSPTGIARLKELTAQSILYGDSTYEPQSFVGLQPRLSK